MRRNGLVILFMLFAGVGLLAAGLGLVPLPFNLGDDKPVTAAKPELPPGGASAKRSDGPAPFAKVTEGSTPTQTTDTTIDVARISPDGGSVFAGHAAPNSNVTVYEDGKPVASGKADGEGEWSLVTDHKFASLDPNLSIKAGSEPGPAVAAADTGAPDRTAEKSAPPAAAATEEKRAPAAGTAKAATADLMSKFEALVAQARKDAESEGKAADATPPAAAATPPSAAASGEPPGSRPAAVASAIPATPADPRADAAETHAPAAERAQPPRPAAGTPLTVPVPIMFVYDQPTLTDEGRHATALLLEYVRLKHLDTVSLSGHADERGSGEYNLDLSRERLETVARLLRDGGFSGKLDLAAKGETEPFTGIDRSKYTGEALFQLDRRVELHLTQ